MIEPRSVKKAIPYQLNCQSQSAASGQVLRGKAIRVGTCQHQGETLELWDCGTPNIVPVVKIIK